MGSEKSKTSLQRKETKCPPNPSSAICARCSSRSLFSHFQIALPASSSALEEMFAGLDLVQAPLALGVWPSRRPLEVMACEAVSRLELVEPRDEPLVGSSHSRVRLLLIAGPVLAVLGSDQLCLSPLARFCQLCFRDCGGRTISGACICIRTGPSIGTVGVLPSTPGRSSRLLRSRWPPLPFVNRPLK